MKQTVVGAIPARWVDEIYGLLGKELPWVSEIIFTDIVLSQLDLGNEYIVMISIPIEKHEELPELTEKAKRILADWTRKQDFSDFAIFPECSFHMNHSLHLILTACR